MLKVNLAGTVLKNPVIGASGTVAYGQELNQYYDVSQLGGLCTSGVTHRPKPGNTGLRIHETPSGLMNSIGLQNPSIAVFKEEELPAMERLGVEILANVGGNNLDDYLAGIHEMNETDIELIELNISCPNVKEGGMAFGIQCASAERVVRAVRAETDKTLIVKLSPNAENIQEMAVTCEDAGADALSLVNTFNALAIDIDRRRPVFDNVTAGLSGPAIKPLALRMVHDVAQVVDVPLIGIGGISTWEDAVEFIMAGSTAVQVGTANLVDPLAMPKIIQGLEDYMTREGIQDLSEIRGII